MSERVRVTLYFPSRVGSYARGIAKGWARITKAQIIVEEAEVTYYNPARGRLAIQTPIRFDRSTLFRIPRDSRLCGWCLSERPEGA